MNDAVGLELGSGIALRALLGIGKLWGGRLRDGLADGNACIEQSKVGHIILYSSVGLSAPGELGVINIMILKCLPLHNTTAYK